MKYKGKLKSYKTDKKHLLGVFTGDKPSEHFVALIPDMFIIGATYIITGDEKEGIIQTKDFYVDNPKSVSELEIFFKLIGLPSDIICQLWKLYKEDTIDKLLKEPEKVKKEVFIDENKLNELVGFIRGVLDTENFKNKKALKKFGFSDNITNRIIKSKSKEEIAYAINEDIFSLCDIVSYSTVDKISKMNRISLKTENKGVYLVQSLMEKVELSGSLYTLKNNLLDSFYNEFNSGFEKEIISKVECERLVNLADGNTIKIVSNRVFLKKSEITEKNLAVNIVKRINRKKASTSIFKPIIAQYEKENNITFAEKQKESILTALTNSFSVITGGPGTGKTTVIKGLIYAIKKVYKIKDDKICLLAPTGKAARRMSEATGMQAKTIHSELKIDLDGFSLEKINTKVVIVDEVSMLDQKTATILFESVPEDSKLILIGDIDQLQSVGAGDVLNSIIKSNCVPYVRLNAVYRQDSESSIIQNAISINNMDANLIYDEDFEFIEVGNDKEALETSVMLYSRISKDIGSQNISLLCPRRKDSECCVNTLNLEIQSDLNEKNFNSIKYGNLIFYCGDNVIQTKNYRGTANGDVGKIISIYEEGEDANKKTKIKIDFSGNIIDYSKEEMVSYLELAYATTIHKSQGSEYDTVIITLLNSHYNQLQKNLFYTAVTRAKRKVIIIGQKKALNASIKREDSSVRNTLLSERICIYNDKFKEKTA